jgi:hypothetical protein
MSLLSLLVALLLVALVVWAVRTLVPALGLPEPIATVIYVIVVVLVVFWFVGAIGGPTFVRLR